MVKSDQVTFYTRATAERNPSEQHRGLLRLHSPIAGQVTKLSLPKVGERINEEDELLIVRGERVVSSVSGIVDKVIQGIEVGAEIPVFTLLLWVEPATKEANLLMRDPVQWGATATPHPEHQTPCG